MSSIFKYLEWDSETHPSLFTVEPAASREIYDESKGTLVFSNFKFFLRKMTATAEMMIQLVWILPDGQHRTYIKAWFETLKEINGPGFCVDRNQWTNFAFAGELPCSPAVLGTVFPLVEPKSELSLSFSLWNSGIWLETKQLSRRQSMSRCQMCGGKQTWDRREADGGGEAEMSREIQGIRQSRDWCVWERGLRSYSNEITRNPATQQARRWFRIMNGSGWYRPHGVEWGRPEHWEMSLSLSALSCPPTAPGSLAPSSF